MSTAIDELCDNDAEREFIAATIIDQPRSKNKKLEDEIKRLLREKRVLRNALRELTGQKFPYDVQQLAQAALTAAASEPDLGLREPGETYITPFTGEAQDSEKIILKRHSFRADPVEDATVRMTPEKLAEMLRAE